MEQLKSAWHSFKHHTEGRLLTFPEVNRVLQQMIKAELQMGVSVSLRSHEKRARSRWEGAVSVQGTENQCFCYISLKWRYKWDQLSAKFKLKWIVPFCLWFPTLIILTLSVKTEWQFCFFPLPRQYRIGLAKFGATNAMLSVPRITTVLIISQSQEGPGDEFL